MEEDIIAKAASGDEAAFEEIVNVYGKRIYNIALRICKNPTDAEDIAQEVFIKLFRALPGFKGDSAFTTFLYRVTSNACLDFLRKRKKTATEPLTINDGEDNYERSLPSGGETPEEAALRKELRLAVQAGIAALPTDQRIALTLRDIEGLSYEEIAEALVTATGTVKSRINRARERLRSELKKSGTFRELAKSNRKREED